MTEGQAFYLQRNPGGQAVSSLADRYVDMARWRAWMQQIGVNRGRWKGRLCAEPPIVYLLLLARFEKDTQPRLTKTKNEVAKKAL